MAKDRAGARIRRVDLDPPVEFGGDPVVWAAWLYYEERMTQEEIALRLGMSRASVVNLLQSARDRGVVTIAIAPEHLRQVSLSRALAKSFRLGAAVVVPDDGGRRPTHERIGQAAAAALVETLRPEDTLGVAWGRTVLALSVALPVRAMPKLSVVQVTGSAMATYAFSAELCTTNIAVRLGARCVNLHAPGIVSRAEVRDVLMAEPTMISQFALIRACDKIVFGVATVDSASILHDTGYMESRDSEPYRARGAVGVMIGRFIDADGQPVRGDLDGRMIGVSLEELRNIPERICVAGGLEKVVAIRAMLRGGHATTLVTDEATALALLRDGDDSVV